MTLHRRSLKGLFGLALVGAIFASMLFGTASASAARCFFVRFCPPPTTTTTATTSSTTSASSSTVTATSTTSVTATQTTTSSSGSPDPTSSGLPALTQIAAGSGTHGFPYNAVPQTPTVPGAPFYNLSALGYVENEYLMSGGATEYSESSPWGSNGNWGVSVSQKNVPYTTNLIVRYPTNPAKFNGTVVIEWLNVVTGGDQDPVWAEIANEALSDGYAYIGVTPQTVGMNDLKTWDPVRYGSLGDSSDLQSYDIYTQAAEAAKDESATLLGGLSVKHVIAAGDSESAFRVVTYENAIQPVTHAFDAFMTVGRAVDAAPLGNGLIAASPFPAHIRTDNTAPTIQFYTQGDVVITNPTHFAVALRYDERRMRAPMVVAKGADVIATRIREVATEHLVPIFEAPPLARALHASVDIGEEIPSSLYVSVAQVLTYIYQLRTARRGGAAPPAPPTLDPTVDAPRH